MTHTTTPTEELEIRQLAEVSWSASWAHQGDLTARQGFIEGYVMAWGIGIASGRSIRDMYERRLGMARLESRVLLVTLVAVAVAALLP